MTTISNLTNTIPNFINTSDPFNSMLLTFINTPQLGLAFIYKAKNLLVQNMNNQITLLKDILDSLMYIFNTEKPITSSSLKEANVALLEIDGQGKIPNESFVKYKNKINDFLTNMSNLKSGDSNQFAKTNIDALEDIYTSIVGFKQLNETTILLYNNILNSIDSFRSVNIYGNFIRETVSKIRDSITIVDQVKNDISRISSVIELLSGTAVIESLSIQKDILDPLLANKIPEDSNILGTTESVFATSISQSLPITTTKTTFISMVNSATETISYPSLNAQGTVFLASKLSSNTYNIPSNTRLYVKVSAPAGPQIIAVPEGFLMPPGVIPIDLTPGSARTINQVMTDIQSGLNVLDNSLTMVQYGYCEEFGNSGSNRIMIYTDPIVTKLEILPAAPGKWVAGLYTPALESAHDVLGFTANQTSSLVDQLDIDDLIDCINIKSTLITASKVDDTIKITTKSSIEINNLSFLNSISTDIGLTDVIGNPSFIILHNNDVAINPKDYDIYVGCIANNIPITEISGNKLLVALPPGKDILISIFPDLTIQLQTLLTNLNADIKSITITLDQIISPILASPSIIQLAEAQTYIQAIISIYMNIVSILNQFNTTSDNTLLKLSNDLVSFLQSKGQTRYIKYLNNADFKNAFQKVEPSEGTNLMSKMENIVNG